MELNPLKSSPTYMVSYSKIDGLCQSPPGNYLNRATGELVAARCNKWDCRTCGPRRARRFVARVLRTPRFSYFVTLTAPPHSPYLDAAIVRSFNASWRSWKRWLKRSVGVGHCSWVLERGEKTGHLHRHALIETGRRFSYLAARAALVRCGLGSVCDFKRVPSRRAKVAVGRYIGKYLAKQLGDCLWPRYTRRAQTSIPDNRTSDPNWSFIARPRTIWRRWAECEPRLSEEMTKPSDFRGWQLPLALNQYEKVRHEVPYVWIEFIEQTANRGP